MLSFKLGGEYFIYISDYRERAKESLSGRWLEPIMVNIIMILISASTGFITEVIPQLRVFSIIISGPLYLGVAFYFSQFVLNKDLGIRDMFYGFNYLWGKSILLYFFTGLFTLLWLLCFIVPGIIKAFAYAMHLKSWQMTLLCQHLTHWMNHKR